MGEGERDELWVRQTVCFEENQKSGVLSYLQSNPGDGNGAAGWL